MGNEKQKVLEMVAEGRITPEEGVRLIEALGHAESGRPAPSGFLRRPFGVEIPEIRIPKIDLGNLGEMYVQLKNTVVDTAKTAQGSVRHTRAGKFFEFKDYSIDFANTQDVSNADLNIDVRAGKLKLKGSSIGDNVLLGKIKRVPEEPQLTCTFAGDRATATVKHSLGRCSMRASEDLTWRMKLNNAAADSRLSMEDLIVEEFSLDNNAGNVDMSFGDLADSVKISIENNAGNVHLGVPDDFAVRIKVSGNLSSNNLDKLALSFFEGVGKSADWDSNKRRFDITVNQNVANFTLDWKKPLKVDEDSVQVQKMNGTGSDEDDDMD